MKMVVVNGVSYPNKEITFNDFCTFEERGIDLQTMEKKPLSFLRVYISLCMNTNEIEAGKAIDAHIANGGSIEDLLQAMSDAIENSGFFRPQQQTAEKDTSASETKSEEKK